MSAISPLAGPRLHYVTVVWGAAYTRRFVDVVLPTHAGAGNLGALRDRPGDVYFLYTTREDMAVIDSAPVMKKIREMIEVRWVDLDAVLALGCDKYGVIGHVHRQALDEVNHARAAAVFLSPDAVFADGAFARLRELTLRGVRRVLVAGYRAKAEPWISAVREDSSVDDAGVWTIPSRTAMAAALRHPHPCSCALRWDAEALHETPSHLYFPAGEVSEFEGGNDSGPADSALLVHGFHLHPLLVWPRQVSGLFASTVDSDLGQVAAADEDEIHVVADSDEIAAVELSDPDALPFEAVTPRTGRPAVVARWALEHTDADHRRYVRTPILLHGGGVSEASLAAATERSAGVVDAVCHQIEKQDAEQPPGREPVEVQAGSGCEDDSNVSRLHFIVPVWGRDYIERFLRWGLPSFLAPGNLPAVAGRAFGFDIVTDAADLRWYEGHPAMDRLRSLVKVRFLTPDDEAHRHGVPDDSLGYTKMTRYYNAAIARAAEPGVAHVFLTPEGIFSDGMFVALLRRLDEGYRAVALPGFRVLEDTAIDAILDHHVEADGTALSARPRELVQWVLRHPHPITGAHTWRDGGARLHPHYYWPVGDEGFVAHCFHVHPLVVRPETPGTPVPPGQTLDHEYLRKAVPLHKVHLVTDSDEMTVIDIARDGHLDDTFSPKPYTAMDVADFAAQWTNGYHRAFFERSVRVHTAGADERWAQAEAQAMAHVAEVLGAVYRRVSMPVYGGPIDTGTADLQADLAPGARPWWMRQAVRVERKQARLRHRVREVGWLRAFAVRTRLRRAGYRVKHRLRPSVKVVEP